MNIYGYLASVRDYALDVIVSAVLRKISRPDYGQIPQKPILDDLNSISCCFAKDMCAKMFERLEKLLKIRSRTSWCGAHDDLAIRSTGRVKYCQRHTIEGS